MEFKNDATYPYMYLNAEIDERRIKKDGGNRTFPQLESHGDQSPSLKEK